MAYQGGDDIETASTFLGGLADAASRATSRAVSRMSSRSRSTSRSLSPWSKIREELSPRKKVLLDRLLAEPDGKVLLDHRLKEAKENRRQKIEVDGQGARPKAPLPDSLALLDLEEPQEDKFPANLPTDLENKIIARLFLQDEETINAVKAPSHFAEYDTMYSNSKSFLVRYKSSWDRPFRRNFTGVKKDQQYGSPTARYFLKRLNDNQEECPLSEKEFRRHLVRLTDEPAWDRVSSWVESGLSTQEIYNRILSNYDYRMTPDEAERQLRELNLRSFGCWSEVEGAVEKLATRAKLGIVSKHGTGQRVLLDHLATKHLLRLMPESVKGTFEHQIRQYANATGREVTLEAFISMSGRFRDQIDRHMLSVKRAKGLNGGNPGQVHEIEKTENKAGVNNSGGSQSQKKGRSGNNLGTKGVKTNPNQNKNGPGKFAPEGQNGRGYSDHSNIKGCKKCRMPTHEAADCIYIDGPVAKYLCTECHLEGYHFPDKCIFKQKLLRKKGELGPGYNNPQTGGGGNAKN